MLPSCSRVSARPRFFVSPEAQVFILVLLLLASNASATIFGTIRGVVRDVQGRPVAGAAVTLRSQTTQWARSVKAGANGAFSLAAVPLGSYTLEVRASGLAPSARSLVLNSGAVLDVPIELAVATVSEEVQVTAATVQVDPRSSTTQTTVPRKTIAETPGADLSNSLAMITDFVPGASMVHDQLHIRGGHQVEWMIDGVPVPNTNIASNVGPQFDPRDIESLEVQRGGYSAEYGDRTYAVFNVVPRSGFERSNEGHLLLSLGTRNSTDDQINLGSHSERFAYYISANGNRSDAGLETPIARILNDSARGFGGFASLIFLPTGADQLRLITSARADHYDIPNDEDLEAASVRDREREQDAFVNLSWVRVLSPTALLTVAPFFHANAARFEGGPDDPIVTTDHRASHYTGAHLSYAATLGGHEVRAGAFGFSERDSTLFGLRANDGSGVALSQTEKAGGNVESLFAEDQYSATSWLTVRGGLRYTRFRASLRESVLSPRAGASIHVPGTNAVFRVSYGDYYQEPPLSTVSGPLLALVLEQGFGFLPLHGERDRQAEVGIGIPVAGWTVDAAAFRTNARNFFDHDALGSSNIFFPLTIDRVFIRGFESTVQSPSVAGRFRVHLAYSHQTVEGEGGVVGGLTDFTPPVNGRFFLDHDQRDTLSAGTTVQLPRSGWIGGNLNYGSGFLNGDGPDHLPNHTTLDLAAGAQWNNWSLKLTSVNVFDKRYLLDRSNTFGGTHFNDARKVSIQVDRRFGY
jgi:outer membrane cobalamin receptor